MNFAAWTAGQALPDQAFSKEDPFKMSVYPRNQRISNKTQPLQCVIAQTRRQIDRESQ
jgi:hypothetical protein